MLPPEIVNVAKPGPPPPGPPPPLAAAPGVEGRRTKEELFLGLRRGPSAPSTVGVRLTADKSGEISFLEGVWTGFGSGCGSGSRYLLLPLDCKRNAFNKHPSFND